ncbi:hypothetical protein [Martelella soudanensis]|uniref:hypothetical protein n=1 Tax=unclassified Martelella TaxID=2629616 RepID=UPI0015DF408D|nr:MULTISPECIES: hypothetical protein [unclassified Martelella]
MTQTTTDQAENPPFEDDGKTLFAIVGQMIPASARHDVPGADDPAIYADILRSVGRDRQALIEALSAVEARAVTGFATLAREEQAAILREFRVDEPALAGVIEAVTARCYYRDDRVMASIGIEVRPPFPEGYQVEEGDWSLLDPVRARGPIWRSQTP